MLVVDDNQSELQTLRIKLAMVAGPGIEIVTAGDVVSAVDRYNAHTGRFDVMWLNYRIGMDATGIQLKGVFDLLASPHPAKAVLYSGRMHARRAQEAAKGRLRRSRRRRRSRLDDGDERLAVAARQTRNRLVRQLARATVKTFTPPPVSLSDGSRPRGQLDCDSAPDQLSPIAINQQCYLKSPGERP